MVKSIEIGEKRSGFVPGWWCQVKVDGVLFKVGMLAIPTDGTNPDTWGVVLNSSGRVIWNERVPAACGVKDLLLQAGLS